MKKVTRFWQKYCKGCFGTLSQFKKAAKQQREEEYLDDSMIHLLLPKYDVANLRFDKRHYRSQRYFYSDHYLHYQEIADWQNMDPLMLKFAANLISELKRQQVAMYVHTAFATDDALHSQVYKRGCAIRLAFVSRRGPLMYPQEKDVVDRLAMAIATKIGVAIARPKNYEHCEYWLADWRDRPIISSVGDKISLTVKQLERNYA